MSNSTRLSGNTIIGYKASNTTFTKIQISLKLKNVTAGCASATGDAHIMHTYCIMLPENNPAIINYYGLPCVGVIV